MPAAPVSTARSRPSYRSDAWHAYPLDQLILAGLTVAGLIAGLIYLLVEGLRARPRLDES